MVRSNVYIDGFNLYYGAVKDTPYKWLNVDELCRQVLPGISINRLRYFTALVKSTPTDQQVRQRQDFYIRALQTLPNTSIHYGHYLQSVVSMRLAAPPVAGSAMVDVMKMEEKGSDVNIATYMLVDAFRADCDQLVVVTNDSDLAEPVRIINKELKIPVVILNPHTQATSDRRHARRGLPGLAPRANPSVTLQKYARLTRAITSDGPQSHVARSQFPSPMLDVQGRTISKPPSW